MDRTSLPPPTDCEQRTCEACDGEGVVHENVRYCLADGAVTAEVNECAWCDGEGTTSVFVYPKPARATVTCSGCGAMARRRELVEVGPEQAAWSLTAREGDLLCAPCARAGGVL